MAKEGGKKIPARGKGNGVVTRIGVISDTHDFFDPKIREFFSGVDHIIHGGDIGLPWIVLQLQEIAPVTAVLGNTDERGLNYRETEVVELGARNKTATLPAPRPPPI